MNKYPLLMCLLLSVVGLNCQALASTERTVEIIPFDPEEQRDDLGKLRVERNQLYVRFTGAGGVYIATKDLALLGDPYFTNSSLGTLVTLRDLRADEALLDKWLPSLDYVAGVIVGHGHYDHLADVPSVMARLPSSVKLVASKTSNHLLASAVSADRRIDANGYMASASLHGEWIALHPRIRVLPIQSEHSPHIADIVFASDVVNEDLAALPGDVADWHSGTTLSYVIDILDEDKRDVLFRIFYQSSASSFPLGVPPQWVLEDGVGIDLAVLCAANYSKVSQYPEGLLTKIKPRNVMLIHWEKFWDAYLPGRGVELPGVDLDVLGSLVMQNLPEKSSLFVPQRGASIILAK